MGKSPWYINNYRRCLVDMHIEDWHDGFLSQFDPASYVKLMKRAGVQTVMFDANSLLGYCHWPTRTGYMHRGLKGLDAVAAVIDNCHRSGMSVVLSYIFIHNNWAYHHHLDWRVIDADGAGSREAKRSNLPASRYGTCCPNSGYREFALSQVEELCRSYEFEGMFCDMTFWPAVCYCAACRKRFSRELGGEMPEIIQWDEPRWLAFQKKREDWITEFVDLIASTVKKVAPEVTVNFQLSAIKGPWRYGITDRILATNDYAGGDFYGGFLQHSFISKLYYNASSHLPFEIHTSRCYGGLYDHTTTKPSQILETNACLYLAHGGAFLFIDAVNLDGTLNPRLYETIGKIFGRTKGYEKFIGGQLCQDVGVYFSFNSKKDPGENGRKPTEPNVSHNYPHLAACLGAVRALKEHHIPCGVICKRNLADLSRHKIVVLPDILEIDDAEVRALEEFLLQGGSLYASGSTALTALASRLGVLCRGFTEEKFTYMTPLESEVSLFPGGEGGNHLIVFGPQAFLELPQKAKVRATITLPFTHPNDEAKFASSHSDPPGNPTTYPAVAVQRYAKGTVLWSAAPIESAEPYLHRDVFVKMIRSLATEPFSFEADAPAPIEITLLHQNDKRRFVVSVINEQEDVPLVPASGVIVRVFTGNQHTVKALLLPEEKHLACCTTEGYTRIEVPTVSVLRMVALDYE